MGDVRQLITGQEQPAPGAERGPGPGPHQEGRVPRRAKGHPEAVAQAMVDPSVEVVEAQDQQTGAVRLLRREEVEADRGRFQAVQLRKAAGNSSRSRATRPPRSGWARSSSNEEDLKGLYGLRGKLIRVDGPTWVDSLVTVLTDPYVSWLLLFVGLFMLVIELKLPGIGLPAITSALAFLLFFWSHYLSGTADQLEIILFLVGMVCLALELFVFPGFGVFGMSGHPADARQHRDGQPHVRLADPGVRIPRDGPHAAPAHGRPRRGRRWGGGPGALLPVAPAVQPPDPQARALERDRDRRPDRQAARSKATTRWPSSSARPAGPPAPPARRARPDSATCWSTSPPTASTSSPTAWSRSSTSRALG